MIKLSLTSDLADRRAFLDPAGGKQSLSKSLARSAIVIVARDWANRFFVLDAWADRVSTDSIMNKIFETQGRWSPLSFGIESSGQQSLFVDAVTRIAAINRVKINILPVKQSTRQDKFFRIRTALQRPIVEGRLFIEKRLVELRAELASFPTGKTVDLVDALASCITMFPPLITQHERKSGMQDYRDFLREEGLTEEEIHDMMVDEYGSQAYPFLGETNG